MRTLLFILLLLFLSTQILHAEEEVPVNLLKDLRPVLSHNISHIRRMDDGIASAEGDLWNGEQATIFKSQAGFVVYDLGSIVPVDTIYLQADNNDTYVLTSSLDGKTWTPLWVAPTASGAGLRERLVGRLNGTARFVKIVPGMGDGAYSIGELQIFSSTPSLPLSTLKREKSNLTPETGRDTIILFGLTFLLAILLTHSAMPRWLWSIWSLPLYYTIRLCVWIYQTWPVDEGLLTFFKAIVAFLAFVTLLRLSGFPKKFPFPQKIAVGLLSLFAILSVGVYYHFGYFQFHNLKADRQTPVHTWDMRVYFPVAKYFPELRFDGLYLACLQAYLDNHPETTSSELDRIKLRSLTNNEVVRGSDVLQEAIQVKQRFRPYRWEEFRRDMTWFEEAMGRNDYLGSMTDHGGNATPVWMWSAHYLFQRAKDIERGLTLTALIDPLLLLLLFVVISRTFGIVPMLICMIIFGATDYYRFGSNLAGSTLRQDWLVALGLGVCALRKERYVLGGILFAYSSLIRAFPALGVFFLAAPLFWELIGKSFQEKQISLPQKLSSWAPFWKTALGVTLCAVFFFSVTSLKFSYQHSWGEWFQKISIHANKPNVNHLGFRNLFSFDSAKTGQSLINSRIPEPWTEWQRTQRETFKQRKPYYLLAIVAMAFLTFLACRKKSLYQSALLGLLFIPVIFYPANYYFHYVFLLPLLALNPNLRKNDVSPFFVITSSILLLMCSAQYLTLSERWADVCFTEQAWILIIGFGLILMTAAGASYRSVNMLCSEITY